MNTAADITNSSKRLHTSTPTYVSDYTDRMTSNERHYVTAECSSRLWSECGNKNDPAQITNPPEHSYESQASGFANLCTHATLTHSTMSRVRSPENIFKSTAPAIASSSASPIRILRGSALPSLTNVEYACLSNVAQNPASFSHALSLLFANPARATNAGDTNTPMKSTKPSHLNLTVSAFTDTATSTNMSVNNSIKSARVPINVSMQASNSSAHISAISPAQVFNSASNEPEITGVDVKHFPGPGVVSLSSQDCSSSDTSLATLHLDHSVQPVINAGSPSGDSGDSVDTKLQPSQPSSATYDPSPEYVSFADAPENCPSSSSFSEHFTKEVKCVDVSFKADTRAESDQDRGSESPLDASRVYSLNKSPKVQGDGSNSTGSPVGTAPSTGSPSDIEHAEIEELRGRTRTTSRDIESHSDNLPASSSSDYPTDQSPETNESPSRRVSKGPQILSCSFRGREHLSLPSCFLSSDSDALSCNSSYPATDSASTFSNSASSKGTPYLFYLTDDEDSPPSTLSFMDIARKPGKKRSPDWLPKTPLALLKCIWTYIQQSDATGVRRDGTPSAIVVGVPQCWEDLMQTLELGAHQWITYYPLQCQPFTIFENPKKNGQMHIAANIALFFKQSCKSKDSRDCLCKFFTHPSTSSSDDEIVRYKIVGIPANKEDLESCSAALKMPNTRVSISPLKHRFGVMKITKTQTERPVQPLNQATEARTEVNKSSEEGCCNATLPTVDRSGKDCDNDECQQLSTTTQQMQPHVMTTKSKFNIRVVQVEPLEQQYLDYSRGKKLTKTKPAEQAKPSALPLPADRSPPCATATPCIDMSTMRDLSRRLEELSAAQLIQPNKVQPTKAQHINKD